MEDIADKAALRPSDPLLHDPEGDLNPAFVAAVAEAVAASDGERVRALMADLHEADVGALLEALEPEIRPRLIELLGRDFDFTALTEVDEGVREDILDELKPETVVEGVRELESDDAVTILEGLDEAEKTAILDRLPPIERVALQRSLEYPEHTAGRRMQTEFIAVPAFWTVGQTIDYMRDTPDLPETFYEIFVIDPGGHLVGTVHVDTSSPDDMDLARQVVAVLEHIAGRIVCNGWPTGVAVVAAQHHGGPWPATTVPAYTSVGTAAIRRWLVPVAYQDFPPELLPAGLR